MSSLSQASWLCSLHMTKKNTQPTTHILPKSTSFKIKPLKFSTFALNTSNEESSPEPTSSNVSEKSQPDRVKLALQKAMEYKKSLQSQKSSDNPVAKTSVIGSGNEISGKETQKLSGDTNAGKKEVPEAARPAMEKTSEYEINEEMVESDRGRATTERMPMPEDGDGEEEVPEAIRVAMEKARKYKKNKGVLGDDNGDSARDQLPGSEVKEVPDAIKIAMGRASEYKKKRGIVDDNNGSVENANLTGEIKGGRRESRNGVIETNATRKGDLKVSSLDFVGLNFADKKSGRGLPAGLVPVSDPYPDGDLPDVEILVGDASKFGNMASPETKNESSEENSDLYKPKVTTWGMFPRPSNISKTFGGGRTLRPGDVLEKAEDRAAKEARTRQLLAAYKRKTGLNIDPKLKSECGKALKDGDSLMDRGRLEEALPYYQKVIDSLAFQTELHGLAALQWSICQDSLSRPEKARGMYEKLQTHPNSQVSKRARQFMFSFQAMEMLKVTRSKAPPKSAGYQTYFEAFVEDKPTITAENTETKEDPLNQALPYIIFLASPILLVLLVAMRKGI